MKPLRFGTGVPDYSPQVEGLKALHGHAPPRTAGRPIDALLPLLQKVRQVEAGSWYALCPGHEDKNPSLHITEMQDGSLLIHCFHGCSAAAVLGAVGLSLSDLYAGRPKDCTPEGRQAARAAFKRSAWSAALGVLDSEAYCLEVAAGMIAAGAPFTDEDCDRLRVAACRIHDAREALLS